MSDRSRGANGSVTSGSFLLVVRSFERRTSRLEGLHAHSAAVCVADARQPAAGRCDRAYGLTRS